MKPQSAGSPRRRKQAPRRKKVPQKKQKPTETSAAGRAIRAGHRPPPKASSGLSVFTVMLLVVALAIAYLMVMVMIPKDLSSIAGYSPDEDDKKPVRNILRESLDTLIARDKQLVLSEEDVNRYLRKRVVGKQGGPMGGFMKFNGVFIDFKKGYVEAYVERSIFGFPFTMSCRVKLERFKRQVSVVGDGGTIGSQNIPRAQLSPIIKVFQRVAKVCEDDWAIMRKMADIQFEEDRMILIPPR